ncbi:MAG TPA: hypothetical protein ENG78_00405 [Acidiferrobacteraceae bacterium]|nr:hypothetical protein [Acidiferrobacteraceae bacterium]HEX19278.1 hypothetical protein [Acidiferrobacteraceae bacterium]
MSIKQQKWLLGTLACVALPLYAADFPGFSKADLVHSNAAMGQQGFAHIRFEHNRNKPRIYRGGVLDIDVQGLKRPMPVWSSADQFSFKGEVGYNKPGSSISVPIYYQESRDLALGATRYSGFGVQWKNRINRSNSLTVAARFGGNEYLQQSSLATDNTQASIVWSGRWLGSYKPRLTGGFVIGDDRARFEQSNYLARRYYGVVVGGELTLFDKHTPYVSVSVLRNDYRNGNAGLYLGRAQDYTRFSAGWNWQVSSNWKLRADTHYVLGNNDSGFYNGERSRIMFSTEYRLR